jgi:hypothetical protein
MGKARANSFAFLMVIKMETLIAVTKNQND